MKDSNSTDAHLQELQKKENCIPAIYLIITFAIGGGNIYIFIFCEHNK